MRLHFRHMPRALVVALAVIAIVAVLIPTCAMVTTCGSSMGMSLSDLLACDSMWLPSDVAPGVMVDLVAFAFVALFAALITAPIDTGVRILAVVPETLIPHPPDDPLMGRLII